MSTIEGWRRWFSRNIVVLQDWLMVGCDAEVIGGFAGLLICMQVMASVGI